MIWNSVAISVGCDICDHCLDYEVMCLDIITLVISSLEGEKRPLVMDSVASVLVMGEIPILDMQAANIFEKMTV